MTSGSYQSHIYSLPGANTSQKCSATLYMSPPAGLEIRVVLWPQSTRSSGGPPDSAMWLSGGLLETFNHSF